jgi:large subunit ribosomal protein L30
MTMPRKKQEQKPKQLKVTLVKSTISQKPALRKTVEAMGLKKLNSTVVLPDNAAVRGMTDKVRHLVTVDEI